MNQDVGAAELEAVKSQLQKVQTEVTALKSAHGAPCSIPLFEAKGQPAGVGPSDSKLGIFFGTVQKATDTWSITRVTKGIYVLALPGGDHIIDVPKSTPIGVYSFTYERNGVSAIRSFRVT